MYHSTYLSPYYIEQQQQYGHQIESVNNNTDDACLLSTAAVMYPLVIKQEQPQDFEFTGSGDQELLLTSGYYPTTNNNYSFIEKPTTYPMSLSSDEYSNTSSPDMMAYQYGVEQQQSTTTCDTFYLPSSSSPSSASHYSSGSYSPVEEEAATNFDFHPQLNSFMLQRNDCDTIFSNSSDEWSASITSPIQLTYATMPASEDCHNDTGSNASTTPTFGSLLPTSSTSSSLSSSSSSSFSCSSSHYEKNNTTATMKTATTTAAMPEGRPYPCHLCRRAFARKHDLQRHIRVHTGDKPYVCPCCKKAFARTDALKRHLRMEDQCRVSQEVQAMKETGRRRYRNL